VGGLLVVREVVPVGVPEVGARGLKAGRRGVAVGEQLEGVGEAVEVGVRVGGGGVEDVDLVPVAQVVLLIE